MPLGLLEPLLSLTSPRVTRACLSRPSVPASRRACLLAPRVPQPPAYPISLTAVPRSCPTYQLNRLACTRLDSPRLACHRARVSRHSRVPACLPGHPSHESHASSCILMHCMYPHASACIHVSNPCSVRPTPIPSQSLRDPALPPSRLQAPGVQHPSGPHAIGPSEEDCCQSYSICVCV